MKQFIFILLVLIFASCGQNPNLPTEGAESDSGHFDSISFKDSVSTTESKPFSNPAIMYGSDFGNFFKTLYRQGKFDDMISFTSQRSIDEFGEDNILEFYKNEMEFGYEIGKPQSQSKIGDVITLNYDADIDATKVVVRLDIVVENDSCKIVLPNKLKNFHS